MRIALIILLLGKLFIAQAQTISADDAMAIVQRLEADPYHKNARAEMFTLFQWMDETEEVVIFLGEKRLNKILGRKAAYKRHMYMLMLGGMARYDLNHTEDDLKLPEVDLKTGYSCMCNGYRNLVAKHNVKKDRYYNKICK